MNSSDDTEIISTVCWHNKTVQDLQENIDLMFLFYFGCFLLNSIEGVSLIPLFPLCDDRLCSTLLNNLDTQT